MKTVYLSVLQASTRLPSPCIFLRLLSVQVNLLTFAVLSRFNTDKLCEDNAVMIAWASMHRFLGRDYDDYTIDLRSNWDIDEL